MLNANTATLTQNLLGEDFVEELDNHGKFFLSAVERDLFENKDAQKQITMSVENNSRTMLVIFKYDQAVMTLAQAVSTYFKNSLSTNQIDATKFTPSVSTVLHGKSGKLTVKLVLVA